MGSLIRVRQRMRRISAAVKVRIFGRHSSSIIRIVMESMSARLHLPRLIAERRARDDPANDRHDLELERQALAVAVEPRGSALVQRAFSPRLLTCQAMKSGVLGSGAVAGGRSLVPTLCQNVAPLYPRRLANFLRFLAGFGQRHQLCAPQPYFLTIPVALDLHHPRSAARLLHFQAQSTPVISSPKRATSSPREKVKHGSQASSLIWKAAHACCLVSEPLVSTKRQTRRQRRDFSSRSSTI